jgi:hypothetical protein
MNVLNKRHGQMTRLTLRLRGWALVLKPITVKCKHNKSLKVAVQGLDFVDHSLYIHTYYRKTLTSCAPR